MQALGYVGLPWAQGIDMGIIMFALEPGSLIGTQNILGLGPNLSHAVIGGLVYFAYAGWLQKSLGFNFYKSSSAQEKVNQEPRRVAQASKGLINATSVPPAGIWNGANIVGSSNQFDMNNSSMW